MAVGQSGGDDWGEAMRPPNRSFCRALSIGLFVALALACQPAFAPVASATPQSSVVHGLDPGLRLSGHAPTRVIVTGTSAVTEQVRRVGGRVTASLPIVGGVAAVVPAAALRSLAMAPEVRSVTADRAAHLDDMTDDDSSTASNFARTTQATSAWANGDLGQGVGVAVIDTGVSPMHDFAGRLVHGPTCPEKARRSTATVTGP